MGKYTNRSQEKRIDKDQTKSVAWKGIGCVLMIVIPMISIAAAILTIEVPAVQAILPYQLLGPPPLPNFLFATDGLATLFDPITRIDNLYAIILVSLAYMIVIGGIISQLYVIAFRIVNPRKYSPFDAPPPKTRAKKYTR
jgi:hypothetical protein